MVTSRFPTKSEDRINFLGQCGEISKLTAIPGNHLVIRVNTKL